MSNFPASSVSPKDHPNIHARPWNQTVRSLCSRGLFGPHSGVGTIYFRIINVSSKMAYIPLTVPELTLKPH